MIAKFKERNPIHLVCGPPASGKTTYAYQLASEMGAVVFDSDSVTDRMIRAGMRLAGMDEDDRDSPEYKEAYRDAVYETLFDLALENVKFVPVIIAGPFTAESQNQEWPQVLEKRLGQDIKISFMMCSHAQRKEQMEKRGEERDEAKLIDWAKHEDTSFSGPPPFACQLISI